jgi:hypothetical protein
MHCASLLSDARASFQAPQHQDKAPAMANPTDRSRQILAPLAIGELIDKITILEIKSERIADTGKLRNIANELKLLNGIRSAAGLDTPEVDAFARELKGLNEKLWDIEDAIREREQRQDFGPRFVELARGVYQTNDRRAQAKQKINLAFGSAIVEEKSYKGS